MLSISCMWKKQAIHDTKADYHVFAFKVRGIKKQVKMEGN